MQRVEGSRWAKKEVEPVRGVGRDEVEVGEEEGKVERLTGLDADTVKNEKTTAPAKSESGWAVWMEAVDGGV